MVFLAFWFSVNAWLDDPASALESYGRWIVPLVLMVVSSAVLSLAVLFTQKDWHWILAIAVALIPALFFVGTNVLSIAGWAAGMVATSVVAVQKIKTESSTRIKVNVLAMLGPGIRLILVGIIIFLSVAYYASPTIQASRQAKKLPPTMVEMIQDLTRKLVGNELSILPAPERTRAENTIVREVLNQINDLAGPYLKFLPFVLAIGLFLLLQSLNFVFSWLAGLVAAGLFALAVKSGFAKIEKTMVEAEKVTL